MDRKIGKHIETTGLVKCKRLSAKHDLLEIGILELGQFYLSVDMYSLSKL